MRKKEGLGGGEERQRDENVAENDKQKRRKRKEKEREREREREEERKIRRKRPISLEARKAVSYLERRTKQKARGYHCADSLGYNTRVVRGGLV